MSDTWTMEEAKNDFTAVAEAAYTGKAQYVTNDSHPDLMITAKNRDEKLKNNEKEENKRFIEFLLSCPKEEILPGEYEPSDMSGDCKATVISPPDAQENEVMPKKPSFKELLFSIPKGEPFIDEKGRYEAKLRDVEF